MRITNKIIQNNTLSNINATKVAEDTLSSEMSSGKKYVRPSDDPVTAIRALRLQSSVSQITQYNDNNIPDASSWLDTTSDALSQESDVVTSIISQYTKGVNQYMTSSDREIILEQLKQLKSEVYSTGNADYAGRYVFTGYRTEEPLTFTQDTTSAYQITEQLSASDLSTGTHVCTTFTNGGTTEDLKNLTSGTESSYTNVTEQDISNNTYYRIRLAYKNCDTSYTPSISYTTSAGTTTTINATATALSTDVPSPYDSVGDNAVTYLSDTGELLLGKNVYTTLSGLTDNSSTSSINEGEIRVTYQKSSFSNGDPRPENYFYCKTAGADGTFSAATGSDDIVYNASYLTGTTSKQAISYDVGFDQTLQVNTTADEAFDTGIGREVDDMTNAMQSLTSIEGVVSSLTTMVSAATDSTTKASLQTQLDAANKALSYQQSNVKNMFSSGITTMQGYLDQVNVAATDCGSRGSRLELIQTRMTAQKSTFKTLQSDNEDVDLSETAVQLQSAELAYEASLQATAKIMKTNLMQYI